jgi:hypothetical protein
LAAFAAANGEWHNDTVTDFELGVLSADLNHLTHCFMAEDVSAFHSRHETAHKMEVRATNGAGRYLDDGITSMLDNRVGNRLASYGAPALPGECLHQDPLLR